MTKAQGAGRVPRPTRADITRALARMSRPAGEFDAARYFRGDHGLRFYNVGTARMRTLARAIVRAHRASWTIADAQALADALIVDPFLETKSIGIEVVARFRRAFAPACLARWKRWLAEGHSSNWATTDAICGLLIGPLLVLHPSLAQRLRAWSRDRSLWVRRASVVGLIPLARRGAGLDVLYANASTLHADTEDLIHKAVGWALREAGKADAPRLEAYLRANGPRIPRTTVRYAIERFPPGQRAALLAATMPTGPRRRGATTRAPRAAALA
jgi:3-methyladenine DNA glycosylase AlkD